MMDFLHPQIHAFIARLIVASLCGAMIGYERQKKEKGAGIRTHFIVCLAACLTMLVSKYAFNDVMTASKEAQAFVRLDPSRIAAGTITAIGFLGAGTIIVHKKMVVGLTTAAGVWATVGVGLTIGAGFYLLGLLTSILLIAGSVFLSHFFVDRVPMTITVTKKDRSYREIKDELKRQGVSVRGIHYQRGHEELTLDCVLPPKRKLAPLIRWMMEQPEVVSFEIMPSLTDD